jgi:hypothetical protein
MKISKLKSDIPDEQALEVNDEWTCTDPDTGQWAREIEDGRFEIIELCKRVNHLSPRRGEYNVGALTISELGEVIESYYPSIESVVCSGAGWKLVVAEIMSEKQWMRKRKRAYLRA